MSMSAEEPSICKGYSIMHLSMSATASPGSCSSISALSFDESPSSGCLSLTCTETDITDVDLQDVDGLSDDPDECSGSCTSSNRLVDAPLEQHSSAPSELFRLIREDLDKQRDARMKQPVAAASPGAISADGGAAVMPRRALPSQHRALIVGWMRQVATALRLHPSTLFNATSFLDRFVAATVALPADGLLQLLALTCISVAVKYNEVGQVAPAVWLSLAVDPAGRRLYTARDLQRYEFTLLQAIEWRLHDPTIFTFLEHFLLCQPYGCAPHNGQPLTHPAAARADVPPTLAEGPVGSRAAMLAEMSLMYDTFQPFDYSAIALACVSLAERMVYDGSAGPQTPPPPPLLRPAAAAVAVASGLGVVLVAPGLGLCEDALEKCFAALCQAGGMSREAVMVQA